MREVDIPAPRLHAVLVTYKRPEALSKMLRLVASQTLRPARLVIVDNDRASTPPEVFDELPPSFDVRYLTSETNLGPAGGLALGLSVVLGTAYDRDWVVLLDDDNAPRSPDLFHRLLTFAEGLRADDQIVGAVGAAGARLNLSTGRLERLRDQELHGVIPVDYIGGGQFPLYSVQALREAGSHKAELFFGFEELELGLRMKQHGYGVYVDGALHLDGRTSHGRLDLNYRPRSALHGRPSWRRYYSLRNQIWILRSHELHRLAARVALVQGILKPLINLPRDPINAWHHLRLNCRAIWHGYRGRMGRTVEPS